MDLITNKKLYKVTLEVDILVAASGVTEAIQMAKSALPNELENMEENAFEIRDGNDVPEGWELDQIPYDFDVSSRKTIGEYLED